MPGGESKVVMEVFLSWSGTRSKQVAQILRDWLPKVLQNAKPWMSDFDIGTGARWSSEIAVRLGASQFGIVCVTPENQVNSWLNFESGALSKTLSDTFVCPYLYDLNESQLQGPLSQFQAALATQEGTLRLIRSLNAALGEQGLSDTFLGQVFTKWWPELGQQLTNVQSAERGRSLAVPLRK